MHWLLLRGLAREQRHFGDFPQRFHAKLGGPAPLCMDLAGFGTQSEQESPDRIEGIVDDLRARFLASRPSPGPWSIFALSLGGMVALTWAARYPGELVHVVVGNTSSADVGRPWERFSPRMWPRLPGLVLGDALTRERTILGFTVNDPALDKEALARAWAGWYEERLPRARSFLRQLRAATRCRIPAQIHANVLVLASTADRLVSFRCSERLAARLGAPLALHDTAGHDLSADAPDWICERIQEHVTPSTAATAGLSSSA